MMTPNDWEKERSDLRIKFSTGDITKATRPELERYLVVLANSRAPAGLTPDAIYTPETEAFAAVVRHILQVRLSEEAEKTATKMATQTDRLVEDTIKLTRFTRGVFWLTVVLAFFAVVQIIIMAIQFVIMLLEYCSRD